MEYLKQIVDYGVVGVLVMMSVISIALLFERVFYYKKVDFNSFKNRKLLENSLSENLTTIASITANAPYIGLFGTVLAIMQTFLDMSKEDFAVTTIMTSLSLALKTTAVGLLVAIISLFIYNYLSRRVENILAKYEDEKV